MLVVEYGIHKLRRADEKVFEGAIDQVAGGDCFAGVDRLFASDGLFAFVFGADDELNLE
jgi:hypothetical protein